MIHCRANIKREGEGYMSYRTFLSIIQNCQFHISNSQYHIYLENQDLVSI